MSREYGDLSRATTLCAAFFDCYFRPTSRWSILKNVFSLEAFDLRVSESCCREKFDEGLPVGRLKFTRAFCGPAGARDVFSLTFGDDHAFSELPILEEDAESSTLSLERIRRLACNEAFI